MGGLTRVRDVTGGLRRMKPTGPFSDPTLELISRCSDSHKCELKLVKIKIESTYLRCKTGLPL